MVQEGAATETVESAGASAGSSSKAATLSNFVLNIAMSASLNQLWGMINGLQIMSHMPLCNIKFPGNAELFNGFMIEIALFDILPSEWMLEQMIYYPPADPFNLNFQILQYESSYSVPNLGTIFFMFLTFLMLVPILITMAFFATDLKELRKHTSNLKDFLFWKGTIRFFTESYMEVLLASGLNLAMFASELDYKGVYFANYFSIALFVLAAGLPLWILIFFWWNISKWEEDEFMNKYSPILEGTRLKYNRFEAGNTWIALMYPVLMLLRRIGFVVTVVFFPDFTWLQMATTFTFI
jgi:hypothetical protein